MKPSLQVPFPMSTSLQDNVKWLHHKLGQSSDVYYRQLEIGAYPDTNSVALFYIDGLVQYDILNEHVSKPLLSAHENEDYWGQDICFHDLLCQAITISELSFSKEGTDVVAALLGGSTILIADGYDEVIIAGTAGWDKRAIEEPQTQTVVRGPKESFTEDIRTNTSLLRRKIRSPDLRFISLRIGRYTQTEVIISYLDGLADERVVEEAKSRLERIDTDSILESGYIEEYIEDVTYSPFPTIMNSERPDAVAAGLLEGQIAILVDGTPFVLQAPVTFFSFMKSSEDYYQRFDIATFIRAIRYISFFVSMLLPSLYIAVTTFHQEMLPTTLLISLAAQRESVPFPALLEALLMEVTFEVLREAGVRMPRVIGSAISIVGALVLGQASVQAGLVSAAMVIIVSFTAISNFVTPALNMAVAARLIRFGLMLLAGSFGLFGILTGCMAILIHLASLRSFGVPYLTPISPLVVSSLKDTLIRVPRWLVGLRPFTRTNKTRQTPYDKPSPPRKDRS
ncbi:spore gernimation protein KA [Paenibacillus pectinilyticus]|uniref:Spore gernimation protein KA n=1 Tax=Paenibacillus pectinilyticus TaxID=512399 RepID=A0A1C0ZS76_9BACL|nr:spore germination protein [Paenibacillus pectinilyticus]OCT10939.1 spore gernimation protein KA [Paenibacillus pectinilyticus]